MYDETSEVYVLILCTILFCVFRARSEGNISYPLANEWRKVNYRTYYDAMHILYTWFGLNELTNDAATKIMVLRSARFGAISDARDHYYCTYYACVR